MPLPRLPRPALLAAALALPLALAAVPAASQAQPGPRGTSGDEWTLPPLPDAAPITRAEHARRRAALAREMGDGVLVVFGTGEAANDYTSTLQTPEFRYLTGVTEPGAALVIAKRGEVVSERLFVLPRNPAREVWEGVRLGNERAAALTGIPAAEAGRLDAAVDSLLAASPTLYTLAGSARGSVLTGAQQRTRAIAARHPAARVVAVDDRLEVLRAAKSPAELDHLRRAILVTVLAHREAARALEPGMNEFELEALIEGTFRRNGADGPAFASIVGSGPNSTTLHYRAADRFTRPGEVVVMDIGASYRGYAADVTRTLPVSGTFTPEQRALYEIVLAAQKAAEAEVRPGATWARLNAAASRVLAEGLARLGLIESPGATYDCGGRECAQLSLFYMHGLGHGIGLEVHDPDVSYGGAFREGSAFTLEPGLYVRADALDHLPDTPANRALAARLRPVLQRYRDTGIRIEDDYFVTATGAERVSEGAPREVAEVEALMRGESPWNRTRRGEVVEWYRGTEPRP